ncbi:basal cell adhesion molecule-like isoform X1 [Petromyzon marinus]|uniref:basal cell adhesion molecule-like isoform X1 n=1 Tax=Petromyzon marinus TaxID=7757 RepID=UPI003F726223
MLPWCLVVLLLLLASFSLQAGGHAAISISVRPLVEVELGRPLVVPCTYNVSVASGVVTQWYIISTTSRVRISYRDSRRFVADADTGYTDRIDAQRDDSALALDATVVADERDFICQVFAGRAGVAEATTRVRLFSAPTVAVTASKRPVLLNGQRHEIGKCFVHNAYPEPHITWYKASLPLLPSPDVKVTRTVATEANGTFAVTSVLSYKPEEQDVGAGYRCVVNYTMPGGRSEAFASETIHVGLHYPEDVRLGPAEATQVTAGATQVTAGATQVTARATQVTAGATQVTAGATQVTAGATQVTPSSSGIPDYKCAEAGEAVSGGATPAPRHARPSGGSGGDGRSRCVTSPHSVPGLVRSRSVKVTVEGGAEEAEESGRGLPWIIIILTIIFMIVPLLVVIILALRHVCSGESEEEGSGGGEAAIAVGFVVSEEEEGGGHTLALHRATGAATRHGRRSLAEMCGRH